MKPQSILQYLLLATIMTLPFAGARFFVLGVPIYMPELMVIFASAVFVWTRCHTDGLRIQKLPTSILIAITMIFLGVISSSILNGLTLVQLGIIKSWFFFPALFGWLVFQTIHQEETSQTIHQNNPSVVVQKTLMVWYATLVLTAIAALFFFSRGSLTYDGRLKAFYLSPNYLALFLFPGVLLGWYWVTQTFSHKKNLRGVIDLTSWILLCVTLYLTLSYTVIIDSLIGFFGILFFTSVSSPAIRIRIGALYIALITVFLLFQAHTQKFSDIIHLSDRSSLASRIMIWQSSAKMISDHPFFGIGPGNFQTTYLAYQHYFPPYLEWAVPHPHNLYLAFWLQTGIIGLIGFLILIVLWIRSLLCTRTDIPKKASVKWTLVGIFITLLLIGLLDTPYWKNDLAYQFWLLMALGL